jgi:hypothetical protein
MLRCLACLVSLHTFTLYHFSISFLLFLLRPFMVMPALVDASRNLAVLGLLLLIRGLAAISQ